MPAVGKSGDFKRESFSTRLGGGSRSDYALPHQWEASLSPKPLSLSPSGAGPAAPGTKTTFPGALRVAGEKGAGSGPARSKGTREVAGGD